MSYALAGNPHDDTLRSVLKTGTKEQVLETYEKFVSTLYNNEPEAVLIYAERLKKYADSLDILKAKALAYRFYASAYNAFTDYQQSIKYWKLQMAVEQKLGNLKNVAYTHMIVASSYNSLNLPDSAKMNFDKSYEILVELNDKRGLGFYYANLAIDLEKRGKLREGMNANYEALRIAESIMDSGQIALRLSAVGTSHARLAEYDKTIEKYEESLKILLKQNNKTQAFHTYSNLGVAYNSLDKNQKALEAHQHSLDFAREFKYEYGQAIASMNIAELLLELNRPDSVLTYLEYSAEIFTKLGTKHPLCYNYKVLGNYYRDMGNTEKASRHLLEAFRLSRELDAPDIHRDAAKGLYNLYKDVRNYEEALNYHEIFKHYSDSLLNTENIAELTKLEEQYNYEQQQKETDLLHQAAMDKQQAVFIYTSGGLGVALMFLALALVQYRRKNTAFRALYLKNMEQSRSQAIKRKKDNLKNGDLFEEIERQMSEEKLFKQKDLSRETLSELLGSNREYVQQAIKDHTDKTVSDYISGWRMEEAKQILSDPKKYEDKTMLQISDEIGLSATSTTTFYGQFKKYTQMTPNEFKKQSKTKP